jgi:hypothetical protein
MPFARIASPLIVVTATLPQAVRASVDFPTDAWTDPGCPFGFNVQRQELQLMWHCGHAADIERRMIVLVQRSSSFEELGLSPELVSRSRERLRALYGIPMGSAPVTRASATIEACRACVGARMHASDRSLALLRSLRRRAHSDQQPLDDVETIRAAAAGAGLEIPDTSSPGSPTARSKRRCAPTWPTPETRSPRRWCPPPQAVP